MNSNRTVEVDKSTCSYCEKSFYEFKNFELEKCPHCNVEFSHKGACIVEETVELEFEIDFKTGKILVFNGF
jgi:ribosomal protein L37AE/L43A